MCGICGIYGLSERGILGKMCDAMIHRGPDSEGRHYDTGVMLGMRRLKVIDLESGDQPVYNEDGSVVVVYNGEIYNFRELRSGLKMAGHVFQTNSDTEVIVHLYEEYGDHFVNKLRGMFACAVWDARKRRLVLARDRIGIKPLYYHFRGSVLSFASELKALLVCPHIRKELNFNAVHDYLTYSYVPAPETIFSHIYKLPPGHLLICENGKMKTEQYWDINDSAADPAAAGAVNEEELSERLLSLMKESVKMHLLSDVPLGVFLSGGTDSATIVDFVSEITGAPVKTFSIGFDDPYYNELDNARLIANKYETDHNEFIIKPQELDYMENVLSSFDEPFADSSAIPTYLVSKHAREYATVALSGDGGDELFGGYGNYRADKITHYYRKVPQGLRRRIAPFISDFSGGRPGYQKLGKLLKMSEFPPRYGHVFWLSVFNREVKKRLYDDEHLKTLLNVDPISRYEHYSGTFDSGDFVNAYINLDIKTVLPDDYLTKVDRMSMLNSLEVRVPFLDHRLVEFSAAIPGRYKLHGLTTKYLLKKIMKKRLPAEIINGRKKGFSMPLDRWFRDDFRVLIERYLSKKVIEKRGYFNHDAVLDIAAAHSAGKKDGGKLLWTLICFEIWHRRFLD